MQSLSKIKLYVLLACCFIVSSVFAQWRIQDIPLRAGWNAVHVEVAPTPAECDELFNGALIESVWKWNKHFTASEFNVDPGTMLPDDPHWLVWFPPDSKQSFLTRLHRISAGSTYLIKVKDSASPFIWSLNGKVRVTSPEWMAHSLSLAGVPVNAANPPTFADYFAWTDEIDTSRGYKNEIFKINEKGVNLRVVAPNRERMERNRAYWVKCKVPPKSSSVLYIKEGTELDFMEYLDEQTFTLKNMSDTDALNVSLKEIAGAVPPPEMPENAGIVPLSYYTYNSASNYWYWKDITEGELITNTLAPGAKWNLVFAVRRNDMSTYTPAGTNGYSYQGILEVTGDSPAGLYYIPVSANQVGDGNVGSRSLQLNDDANQIKMGNKHKAGLWVGNVNVTKVNCPAYITSSNQLADMVFSNNVTGDIFTNQVVTNLMPVDAVFQFRVILHVDDEGKAKLLREVFMANVPVSDEHSVCRLYVHRDSIPPDATDISRISSVNFPCNRPLPMVGDITNRLSTTLVVDCNDPVNPFLHRYNPLHDNKDWDYHTYSNAVETLTVSRYMTFSFVNDGDNEVDPLWGSSERGGVYREYILGLRKQPVMVEGIFGLKRISLLDKLY